MKGHWLLSPPVAFMAVFLVGLALSFVFSRLSYKGRKSMGGAAKPYACGEDIPTHMIQPDYGHFFPFALFFTILHVVALTIATIPMRTLDTYTFAGLYVLGAMVGLLILHRK